MNLRGWVAVAKSPHWFAWPHGPTTKNEQCSLQQRCKFYEASLKREEGRFFARRGGFFWQSRSFFVKVRHFSCNKGEKWQ